jgi:hypothetical protein
VNLPSDGDKIWWQDFDVTPRQLEGWSLFAKLVRNVSTRSTLSICSAYVVIVID